MNNDDPIEKAQEVMKLIPHRYPFLLVDRILSYDTESLIAIKSVTINEPFFQGHFPDRPIMPGVLIVEAIAQAGGVLLLSTVDDPENYLTLFMKIDNVKFKNPVRPGDTLIFKLNLLSPIRRGICHMKGSAFANKKLVTEGEFLAQIVKRDKI